ncbi:MAG: hypothetical protein J0I06_14730 [Planctomycetes bacterium]|nr:hypothetical protein [Planctomycetota bacterium]
MLLPVRAREIAHEHPAERNTARTKSRQASVEVIRRENNPRVAVARSGGGEVSVPRISPSSASIMPFKSAMSAQRAEPCAEDHQPRLRYAR